MMETIPISIALAICAGCAWDFGRRWVKARTAFDDLRGAVDSLARVLGSRIDEAAKQDQVDRLETGLVNGMKELTAGHKKLEAKVASITNRIETLKGPRRPGMRGM